MQNASELESLLSSGEKDARGDYINLQSAYSLIRKNTANIITMTDSELLESLLQKMSRKNLPEINSATELLDQMQTYYNGLKRSR